MTAALRIWLPCIIIFALVGLSRAVTSGGEIGELVYGVTAGGMVGLLLVVVLRITRLDRHL